MQQVGLERIGVVEEVVAVVVVLVAVAQMEFVVVVRVDLVLCSVEWVLGCVVA